MGAPRTKYDKIREYLRDNFPNIDMRFFSFEDRQRTYMLGLYDKDFLMFSVPYEISAEIIIKMIEDVMFYSRKKVAEVEVKHAN